MASAFNTIDNSNHEQPKIPLKLFTLYRKILLIAAALATVSCMQAAETAASILANVVKRVSAQPIEATFTVMASGMTQSGSLTLSGDKFVIVTDDLSTWYDGKTQWTLSTSTNEVNVTQPTKEELAEVNPLIILSTLSSQFNAEMAGTKPGSYELHLVSKSKESGIASAMITVYSGSWNPGAIIVYTATGEQYNILIKTIKNLKNANDETFRFNTKTHPGVEIIDLR
ncbi:MAG: outer-membrane lipoprotein carrier protein LolA [Clostridiales bacterium]|nr:outer-membrane lipoprotein carrier protein LolA [Clostridiales bacterium]